MECPSYLPFVFFVLLLKEGCLCVELDGPMAIHSVEACRLHLPVVKPKYCGTPISYYTNSIATHQILLLKSGEINPNPGPSMQGSTSRDKVTMSLQEE